MHGQSPISRAQLRRRVWSASIALALMAPLRQHARPRREQVDAYPLSFYPMFRRHRPQLVTMTHAVGVDRAGADHYLTDRVLIAGVGFNQARRQLNRAVRRGRADEWATHLAERAAADPTLEHVSRVEIRRGRFDLDHGLQPGGGLVCEEVVAIVGSAPVANRPQPPPPEPTSEGSQDESKPDDDTAAEQNPQPKATNPESAEDPTDTDALEATTDQRRGLKFGVLAASGALAVAAVTPLGRRRLRPVARIATKAVEPAPAARLGSARALTGAYALVYLLINRRETRAVHRTKTSEFSPTGPVRLLPRPVPAAVADTLNDAAIVSSALFALGLCHRVVGPLHSLLLTWTQSYRNSWGMIFHTTNTLVAHTVVLGTSPAADAVSLSRRRQQDPPPHERYGLPLATMRLATVIAYLLAGIAKIWQPRGWTWAKGDALRRHVAINAVRKILYGETPGSMALRLHQQRWLWTSAAVGSLVLELIAPLVLLRRRAGQAWATSMLGVHWGIYIIMRIKFPYQMSGLNFAAWLDLERLPGTAATLYSRRGLATSFELSPKSALTRRAPQPR